DALTGGGFIAPFAIKALPAEKRPSACIGCKSCEKVCPQQIRISEILKAFGSKMDGMLEAFFGKEA
ncbi:MAG: 4Fe-4S binding protein, partial [Candidatus Methanomethylophilus sp.]|nr:4Fe-4S binding protein [Methanomethylophilus sp.]